MGNQMIRKRYHVLLDLILKNNYRTMIEIGVGNGETSDFILSSDEIDTDFKIYGIDPYLAYDYADINSRVRRRTINYSRALFLQEKEPDNFILIKQNSNESAPTFADESICLVFVDGNHNYNFVLKDSQNYWPKVKPGGVMAWHDYFLTSLFPGVKEAIDQFVEILGLELHKDADIVYIVKK